MVSSSSLHTSPRRSRRRTRTLVGVLAGLALPASLLLSPARTEAAPALLTPHVGLAPNTGPPTTLTTVHGKHFNAHEAVDVYFDATDEALATTNGRGAFSIQLTVPSSATSGGHRISAVGRSSGLAARAAFTVNVNWASFRDGPQRTGVNPYENVLSPSTVPGLNELWSFPTGSSVGSSPAVANGVVYVGSGDHNVYALNATTGAELWSYTTGGPVSSSPAVANGVVYVGSYDHNVYALNATTGAERWSYTTGGVVSSSPAVASGVVYVGSNDANVYALNATTGAKLWSYTTGSFVPSSPAVANGVVYVGSYDDNVYALNATTGAALWSSTTGSSVESAAAVANGVVYVGSDDGNVYAYSLGVVLGRNRPVPASLHPNLALKATA